LKYIRSGLHQHHALEFRCDATSDFDRYASFLLTQMMPFRHGAGGARLRTNMGQAWTGQNWTGQAWRVLLDKAGGKIDNLNKTTATPQTSQQKNKMCLDQGPKTAA
jgi:hypothetical protein